MDDMGDFVREQVLMYVNDDEDQLLGAIKHYTGPANDEVSDLQLVAADLLFKRANGDPQALKEAGERYQTYIHWARLYLEGGPEYQRVVKQQKFGRYTPEHADLERAMVNLVACESVVGKIKDFGSGCLLMVIAVMCLIIVAIMCSPI